MTEQKSLRSGRVGRWICMFLLACAMSLGFSFVFHSSLFNLHIATIAETDWPSFATLQNCSTVGAIKPEDMKQERRTKFHHCVWDPHSGTPAKMLTNEFGFSLTDASKNNDWDLIFGGYPNCGDGSQRFDWNMETGLNAQLNKSGWDTLKPHQVWFPCMGCAHSFCNKRELCRFQHELSPDSCYLLPDHKDVLLENMKADPGKLWVLKRDASFLHLHVSTGVWFIDSPSELPDDETANDGTYLVQPYKEPWIGKGDYRRKSEVRFYIAITSTTPFRAYVYSKPWVSISSLLYQPHATVKSTHLEKKCMRDSHLHVKACEPISVPLGGQDSALFIADYGTRTNMTTLMQQSYLSEAHQLLTNVLQRSVPVMESHEINNGIAKSGASCFSFMRADFGISQDGEPFLFEINELPFANQKYKAGEVQQAAYRDLFHMIGLSEKPLAPQYRAEYEYSHRGGWIMLPTESKPNVC